MVVATGFSRARKVDPPIQRTDWTDNVTHGWSEADGMGANPPAQRSPIFSRYLIQASDATIDIANELF
jgi:hypothetical protein